MSESGWYPNPDGTPTERWWDGQQWTNDGGVLASPSTSTGSGNQQRQRLQRQ